MQTEYVDKMKAAEILGMPPSSFDRIAVKEFSRCRIKRGRGYLYPVEELEAFRLYRDRCLQAGTSPLSWNALVARNKLLEEQVAVLKWVLTPYFSDDHGSKNSAANIEWLSPDDYERAKSVLADLGFSLDWLRQRMAHLPPVVD